MELISVHVPKTAGTAFTNSLVKNYGEKSIFRDYTFAKTTIQPGIRVVHGHFPVMKYAEVYPEAKKIAWLRHPASWVISFYYFAKRSPRIPNQPLICDLHDKNLSLIEFASHPIARNTVSRIFLKGVKLEDFFFLGIQEHFQEDLEDLGRALNWDDVESTINNTNPEPGYSEIIKGHYADKKLMRHLESLNQLDMVTYNAALKLRSIRRRKMHPVAGGIFSKGFQMLQTTFSTPRAA